MNLINKLTIVKILLFELATYQVFSKAVIEYSDNGKCGKDHGKCKEGYCCSQLGWCGQSDKHCKVELGCQSDYGQCLGDKDKTIMAERVMGSEAIETTKEVSLDGQCGEGLPPCRKGFCCSKRGWCGNTEIYCLVKNGCQSNYGECKTEVKDDKTKTEKDTSKTGKDKDTSKTGKDKSKTGKDKDTSKTGKDNTQKTGKNKDTKKTKKTKDDDELDDSPNTETIDPLLRTFTIDYPKWVIDLSEYQTITDGDAVAKSYDGVILRVTKSKGVKDEKFEEHYRQLEGKTKIGYYFYTEAMDKKSIKKEVDKVHKLIKDKQNDFPVFIDIESDKYKDKTKLDKLKSIFLTSKSDKNTEIVKAGIKELNKLGYKRTGIYTGQNFLKDWLNYDELKKLSKVYFWVARYVDAKDIETTKSNSNNHFSMASSKLELGPFERMRKVIDMWQFTSKAYHPGIKYNGGVNSCKNELGGQCKNVNKCDTKSNIVAKGFFCPGNSSIICCLSKELSPQPIDMSAVYNNIADWPN